MSKKMAKETPDNAPGEEAEKAEVAENHAQAGSAASPRNKSGLKKAEIQKLRLMLLEKRQGLLADMSGIQAETVSSGNAGDLSSMPTHPADLGTDNYEHEFSLGLLENEQSLLKEIDEALEQIDKETYGVCLGTGKPIGKARLMARPWAKYCIEYARKLELGLVHPENDEQQSDE